MSESAVSAKRVWGSFGAKPAQSERPVRAAAKRRSTRKRPKWKKAAERPNYSELYVERGQRF